jgi:hypothetical protein
MSDLVGNKETEEVLLLAWKELECEREQFRVLRKGRS